MAPVIRLEPRWGTRRQAAEEELELEEVARRRPAPCKVVRTQASGDPDARDEWGNRPAAPTKLTQYDVGNAMPPDQALRYAEWIGARSSRLDRGPGSGQPHLARRASSPSAGASDSDVSDGALASAFGFLESSAAGQPLPDELARQLSAELGLDVSAARLHTDAAAAAAAAAVGARAFALGHDIFFAAGAYDPHTTDGLELLAHEVAHVAQHLRGSAPPGAAAGRKVSRPDDAHEHQADDFARRFAASSPHRFDATDPASLVEQVRRQGQRMAIPGLAELERELGADLGHVQAFTGQAAQRACQLLAAGAFAVRNIVAFADPSPQRETLLHELTHVVQMGSAATASPGAFRAGTLRVGARDNAAEHEARNVAAGPAVHRAATITVAAEPDVIHRTEPTTTPPVVWEPEAAKARFRTFLAGLPKVAAGGTPRFGDENLEEERYQSSTESYFRRSDYIAAALRNVPGMSQALKDDELAHLWRDHAQELGLCKVGNGSYFAWVDPTEAHWGANVVYLGDRNRAKRSITDKWADYLAMIARPTVASHSIAPAAATFNNGVSCPFVDGATAVKPYTDRELGLCRDQMVTAFVACQDFHWGGGGRQHWETYFADVITPPGGAVFAGGYTQIQGTIFGMIATEDINAALVGGGGAINRGEHFFSDPSFIKNPTKTIASDAVTVTGTRIQHAAVVDFKSGAERPDTDMLNAAYDYNLIVTKPVPSYRITGTTQTSNFQHVLYVFTTQEIAAHWAPKLLTKIPGPGVLQIVPDPGVAGVGTIDMTMNPTFQVQLTNQTATTHQIAAPPILHPGISFSDVSVTTAAAGSSDVVSGSATLDVDLGGALNATGIRLPMTPRGGNQVQLENRLPGLTGELSNLLRGVQVDARVTDDGVAGTISVASGTTIGVVTITGGNATVAYSNSGELSVAGQLDLSYAGRSGNPVTGSLTLGWSSGGWTFTGQVNFPEGMVEGLSAFSATLSYGAGEWSLGVDQVSYTRTFNAITLTGTASGIDFNLQTGMLSGLLLLEADLGMFGSASGRAELTDNRVTGAELSYDSPEFRYPSGSTSPTFTGTVGGTITYSDDRFSGSLRGTAGLNIPALQSLVGEGGLGLALECSIDAEGRYSGSISTTSPINLGEHFQIPSISCLITPEGKVEGDFSLRVVNFRHLDNVEIGLHVDRNGVSVRQAAASISFGTEADRFWGTLSASYAQESGLSISGNLSARIKEGMVATGTLTYSSTTNEVDVSLTVEEITLLQHGPVTKTLFEFTRQIPLINAYGIGIYLDIGFDLGFSYQFDLRLQPTISLEGFSLETFEFERAAAEIELRGELVASLTATPRVGLGLFALSPSLLRGGGGVTIPIVGEARLVPTGTLTVAYTPDGGVTGDATLGMPLTFGIRGSVVPYAELSLLDGVWNPSWTGEALTEFEIMPPRELFNFQLDLGGDLSPQEPTIPDAPQAPSAASGPQLAQEAATPTTAEASTGGGRDTTVPTTGPAGEAGGGLPSEPVNLGGLSSGLQALPGYQTMANLMDRAGAAWGAIGDFFGRVVGVFRDFLVSLGDGVQEIIDGFVASGLGYLPQLLRRMVGDTAWTIIEPIITALTSSAEALLGLFETTPPTGITDFFPWALRLAASAWGMVFDNIGSLVSALQTMFDRLWQAATQLVTTMVNQGMVGVKRHHYYIWYVFGTSHFFVANQYKINLLGVSIDYWDQGGILNPASAVAIGLFEVLERMGVPTVGSYFHPEIGEESRDRWA
jgi:Domain of unknown function (DUF4157)